MTSDDLPHQVLSNMRAGKISFDEEEWRGVSPKAKALVTSLLCRDPAKRLTAPELVVHPWVSLRLHALMAALIEARARGPPLGACRLRLITSDYV